MQYEMQYKMQYETHAGSVQWSMYVKTPSALSFISTQLISNQINSTQHNTTQLNPNSLNMASDLRKAYPPSRFSSSFFMPSHDDIMAHREAHKNMLRLVGLDLQDFSNSNSKNTILQVEMMMIL